MLKFKSTGLLDSFRRAITSMTCLLGYHGFMEKLRSGNKEALKFVTPSGVTAVVATSIPKELLKKLADKLEGKLRRSGHLTRSLKSSGDGSEIR